MLRTIDKGVARPCLADRDRRIETGVRGGTAISRQHVPIIVVREGRIDRTADARNRVRSRVDWAIRIGSHVRSRTHVAERVIRP